MMMKTWLGAFLLTTFLAAPAIAGQKSDCCPGPCCPGPGCPKADAKSKADAKKPEAAVKADTKKAEPARKS
jgi:hypothetical protein